MMYRYQVYGLRVSSALELPELIADSAVQFAADQQISDLVIRVASISSAVFTMGSTRPEHSFGK